MFLVLLPRLLTVAFASLPLPQALARLSNAAGERLECAPAFADEVLLVRLRDADEGRALKEIAGLFDARWERRGEGRLLVPDEEAARRHAERVAAQNVASVDGSLATLRQRLAAHGRHRDTPSNAAQDTPGWRAAARLTLALGRSALLLLPDHSRAVWAESPTAMQRAFPSAADKILRDYRKELAALDATARPGRVRLAATKEYGGALDVRFEAVDDAGASIDAASLLAVDDLSPKRASGPTYHFASGPESPLPYSAEEREYLSALGMGADDRSDRAALMLKWRSILMDPRNHEPTGWYPGDRLVAAATALDKNLIGSEGELPGARFTTVPDPQTPSQFLAGEPNLEQRKGWLILRREEGARASREAGARLVADFAGHGGVGLDAAAAWAGASTSPYPFTDWVGQTVGVLLPFGGDWFDTLDTLMDRDRLCLWNSLGASARQALREGQSLDLATLPPSARDWIARTAYWYGGLAGGEPTDLLPTGATVGTVRLSVESETIVVPSLSSSPEGTLGVAMTAERLGRYLAQGDRVRGIEAKTFQTYDRFRLGTARTYHLIFALGPKATPMVVDLQEVFFDPANPSVDRLPEAFRARMEAARAKAATHSDERVLKGMESGRGVFKYRSSMRVHLKFG